MITAEKIRELQKKSQIVALFILILFVALISYSAYKLRALNTEITSAQALKDRISQEMAERKREVDALKQETERLRQERDRLVQEMTEVSSVATEATNELATVDPTKAQVLVDEAIKKTPDITKTLPIIYIQIYTEKQQAQVNQIIEALRNEGYIVQNPGVRANKVPATEVWYFRDEDRAEAQKLADLLKQNGVTDAEPKLPPARYVGTVRPRQYEIWFSSKAFQ